MVIYSSLYVVVFVSIGRVAEIKILIHIDKKWLYWRGLGVNISVQVSRHI